MASSPQQQQGPFGEGIEAVGYQHGQYPEHYVPGPEAPQVHTPVYSTPANTPEKGYVSPPPSAEPPRILGLTKTGFVAAVGVVVFVLLALVVGLGAGLGAKVARLEEAAQ